MRKGDWKWANPVRTVKGKGNTQYCPGNEENLS